MDQHYSTAYYPGTEPNHALENNRKRALLLGGIVLAFALYMAFLFSAAKPAPVASAPSPFDNAAEKLSNLPLEGTRVDSVATVVQKALYFYSLLTTTAQQSALQLTYTSTLAHRWSNLPCTNTCRNGIALGSNLTAAQLAAALDVIKAATGTAANQGYDQFKQIRYADRYLNSIGGGNSYDSSNYYLAFLNTPSTTGAWMIQFGGHHYAANIAYNGGKVVGATPIHEAVEPISFVFNGTTYTPLKQEHDSFAVMLAGLTTAQLTTAKLSGTFGDCVMIPGESNGGTSTFPSKAGLLANTLSSSQKSLVYAAMKTYTSDLDDSTAAVLQALFESQIDSTYIGWTGSGTSGSSTTFLNANSNYVRLDGPRVWIEFVCQNGVLVQNQIHYHSVFRDRRRDYGNELTASTLPLTLLSFDAITKGSGRLLNWTTSNETKVSHFELQRSVNPSSGFTPITRVNANTSSRSNAYTYTDNETVNDKVVYYRLLIADADGKSSYSNIVAVKDNVVLAGISIYPNPAQDLLTITNGETVSNATISILNSSGKILLRSPNRSGRNLNIDISGLSAGSYLMQMENGGKVTTLKFVKQK